MQPGLAERFIQMRCHGLQLAFHLTGRDDQPIRVIGAAGHIQNDDVFGLVVFQAFPRGIHKYFQPIRRKFFTALAAGARDARGRGLGFAIGLGGCLCLGGSFACFWGRFRFGSLCGGALWRGLRGRLGCWCLDGSALWRGFGRSSGLWRSFRLGRSGSFGLGGRFGLGFGLGLGRSLGLGCGGGFGLRRGAPLRAFFSRGGLAGYGRLLSLDTSRVQGCRPDCGGGGSMFPRGDETPSGVARSPLRAGKQRAGGATVPPQRRSRRAMQGAPGPARTGQDRKRGGMRDALP